MVSVLVSSVVDHGFAPSRVKLKTIKLIFVASPLSTQHIRRKSKDWMAWNKDNVSEWGDVSTCGLSFPMS